VFAALLAALLLAGVAVVEFGLGEPAADPNVILIVLDTVRADQVGALGPSGLPITPFLDSLAKDGLVFTRARSAANWTLPAHASMFTGLLPTEHGCHFEHRYLPEEAQTVAEILRDLDYITAGFSANVNVSRAFNLDQGFDSFYETWSDETVQAGASPDAAIEARVAKWLKRPPQQPVFLFVNLMDAHLPYRAAPEFSEHHGRPAGAIDEELLERPDFLDLVLAGQVEVDEALRSALRLKYANAISGLDARLARLYAAFQRAGLLDHAVLIITSDHGENLGDHGLVDHQASLHETVLRVPLILHGSALPDLPDLPDSGRIETPVTTRSLFHWILDMQRNAFRPDLIGPRGLLVSEAQKPLAVLERLTTNWPDLDLDDLSRRGKAAVDESGRFKLIRYEGRPDRIRSLDETAAVPPGELERLGQALDKRLDARRLVRESYREEPPTETGISDALKSLRRLGYLGGGGGEPAGGASIHAQEHLSRGVRAFARDDFETAKQEFLAATSISPAFADAHFNLALVTDRLGGEDARERWQNYLDTALRGEDQDQASIQYAFERLERMGGR